MHPDLLAHFFQIVPIGLASGILSGAFGVGGGIVTVPLIRHIVGVTPHVAVGNSLAVIMPTAVIGAFNYLKQGKLVPILALACGIPAVVGTIAAAAASPYVGGQFLMLLLASLMLLVGLDFTLGIGHKFKRLKADEAASKAALSASSASDTSSGGNSSTRGSATEFGGSIQVPFKLDKKGWLTCLILGLLTGLLSGLLGVGGGFIMVPSFCYFLNLPLKTAFGTSLIVIALVALPSTLVHSYYGHVQLWIVTPMLLGSLPGAWLGSYFALRTKDKWLRKVFGCLLILLAIVFAYKELTQTSG